MSSNQFAATCDVTLRLMLLSLLLHALSSVNVVDIIVPQMYASNRCCVPKKIAIQFNKKNTIRKRFSRFPNNPNWS